MFPVALIALVVAFLSFVAAGWATVYARASARAAGESAATAQRAELRDAARRSEELSAYLVVTAEMAGSPRGYPHLLLKAHHDFTDLIITQTDRGRVDRDLTLSSPGTESGPLRISHLGPGDEYPILIHFEPPGALDNPEPPRGIARTTVHITANAGFDNLDSTYDVTWTSHARSATVRRANLSRRPSENNPQ